VYCYLTRELSIVKIFSRLNYPLILIITLILILFCLITSALPQENQSVVEAPINPAFLEYNSINGNNIADEGVPLGYIPSPVNSSIFKGVGTEQMETESFPSSYDLRDYNQVTPVKDQGNCGDCWAFGTYGSLESYLKPGEITDFSENNLKNLNGFDYGPCKGGNILMSTAYLTRYDGPVLESSDPYNPSSGSSPSGLSPVKHIQEVLFIPEKESALDNSGIKQAIMTYGGVTGSFYYNEAFINSLQAAYYYPYQAKANHEITIVGWNDNFSKNNFTYGPSGNGAYLCKNSWGTTWPDGNQGYFWVSYYDTVLGFDELGVFENAESVDNYARVYQYDPLGFVGSIGTIGSDSIWMANIFQSKADEKISATGFYTLVPDTQYLVQIYSGVTSTPTSGTLIATSSGTIGVPGYHTVTFTPASLSKDQKFSVVLRLISPGYNYGGAVEFPISGYSSGVTSSSGQSYVSSNGDLWADYSNIRTNGNVCIKAFTISQDTGSISISSIPSGASIFLDSVYTGYITPFTLTRISMGSHIVRLTKTLYNDYTANINVNPGETSTLSAIMTLKPSTTTPFITSTSTVTTPIITQTTSFTPTETVFTTLPTPTIEVTPTTTTTMTPETTPTSPIILPLPDVTNSSRSIDSDSLYRDLNGNGIHDFGDVVLYFRFIDWISLNEPVWYFDYNKNGRADYGDVVALFYML